MRQSRAMRRSAIVALLVILSSLFALVPTASANGAAPTSTPVVQLVPRGRVVLPNQEFRVDVVVQGLQYPDTETLSVVDVDIQFDTTRLEYVDVQTGSLLSKNPGDSVAIIDKTELPAGKVGFSVTSDLPHGGRLLANGPAATLIFKVKDGADGIALFQFTQIGTTGHANGVGVGVYDGTSQPFYLPTTAGNERPEAATEVMVMRTDVSGAVDLQARPGAGSIEVNLVAGGQIVYSTVTDGAGHFKFENVQPGSYDLALHPVGIPYLAFQGRDLRVAEGKMMLSPIMLKAGDIHPSGTVDLQDLIAMSNAWRSKQSDASTPYNPMADLDDDKTIYGLDLAVLARNWNATSETHPGHRQITPFEQGLNRWIIGGQGPDAISEAQAAERTLRVNTAAPVLAAAKLTLVRNVLTKFIYNPDGTVSGHYQALWNVIKHGASLGDMAHDPTTVSAVSQFNHLVDMEISRLHLNPADYRDLDNELAAVLMSGPADVVDIALQTIKWKSDIEFRLNDANFMAAYIWSNRNDADFVANVCSIAGGACDLSAPGVFDSVHQGLKAQLQGERWWKAITEGPADTLSKPAVPGTTP